MASVKQTGVADPLKRKKNPYQEAVKRRIKARQAQQQPAQQPTKPIEEEKEPEITKRRKGMVY